MSSKAKSKTKPCPICKLPFPETDPSGLIHVLVAHGPLEKGETPHRRRRTRAAIPKIFRRLEALGYSEQQTHQIIQAVAEELRKIGHF